MRFTRSGLVMAGGALLLAACSGNGDQADSTAAPASTGPSFVATENCAYAFATTPPANAAKPGDKAVCGKLTVKVKGDCATALPGGKDTGMTLDAKGLTARGNYHTAAWKPDGTPYTYLHADNHVTDGGAPDWTWNCYAGPQGDRDTPGTYTATLTDVSTGKAVAFQFVVSYKK